MGPPVGTVSHTQWAELQPYSGVLDSLACRAELGRWFMRKIGSTELLQGMAKRQLFVLWTTLLLVLGAVAFLPPASAQETLEPVPPAAAAPPDDGQWASPAKNYANTRYS